MALSAGSCREAENSTCLPSGVKAEGVSFAELLVSRRASPPLAVIHTKVVW